MRYEPVCLFGCWIFTLVFVISSIAQGQVVQQNQATPAAQDTREEQEKLHRHIVSIASTVISRHELAKANFKSTSKNDESYNEKYIPEIKILSQQLDSLKPNEQALVLRAINCLTVDATATVCSSAIEKHDAGELPDDDWMLALKTTSRLLPDRMYESYLSELEIWQEKNPETHSKSPPRTQFSMPYQMSSSFYELASKSKNSVIAGSAFRTLVGNDTKCWSLLEASANRNLLSKNPTHRLHGVQLFSRLNPTWKGHQTRLKKLTDDPDENVARAAAEAWLTSRPNSDHRRLLEALSAASDSEKLASLRRVDTKVISDWGTIDPLTKLAVSSSVNVRKAALEAIPQTHPQRLKLIIKAIETDPDQGVRQFALNQAELRVWYLTNSTSKYDYQYHSSRDRYYALLAGARRDGLEVERSMQKLSEPFGNRPQTIYDQLESDQLNEFKKLKAIIQLLDSDPSLEATETANIALRKIIAENLEENKQGYLGQASTAKELILLHANRLAPSLEELCSFIEQTKSKRLIKTLPSFGLQAGPALDFMIKILEDDSGTWRDSRSAAIFTIRAMRHHGKPALNTLLKVANEGAHSVRWMAALTYLDLGGDPAALMPKYALQLPVLVKIDPAELIAIAKFKSELKSAVISDCPWDILNWLGPHADFLMPELKQKFKQLTSDRSSYSSEIERLIKLLPLLPSSQDALLHICIEYIESEPRSIRCRTALRTLTKIGDDQRLAENAVKSIVTSGGKFTLEAAKVCRETLYNKENQVSHEDGEASQGPKE